MTETTLRTEDGRTALRIERPLRHPAEKVWRALTRPSELNQWFPFDVEPELSVGGQVRFVDRDGGPPSTGMITDLEPNRVIAYSWEDEHLRWELRPADDGCLLILTHTVADHYGSASYAAGWHACIDGLEDVLLGRPVAEPGDMDAVHERFVVELGLAEGTVRDTADGWTVRFERQLVRFGDVAWRALVDDSVPAVGSPAPVGATVARFAAGSVTDVKAGEVLEYEWLADGAVAGLVRFELRQGTGHGARLVLTQTGAADRSAQRADAPAAWAEHVARLAARLAGTPRPPRSA